MTKKMGDIVGEFTSGTWLDFFEVLILCGGKENNMHDIYVEMNSRGFTVTAEDQPVRTFLFSKMPIDDPAPDDVRAALDQWISLCTDAYAEHYFGDWYDERWGYNVIVNGISKYAKYVY